MGSSRPGVSFSGFGALYSVPDKRANWRTQTSSEQTLGDRESEGAADQKEHCSSVNLQILFKYSNIHLDLFLADEKSQLIFCLLWLSHLQCWLKITKEQWGLSTNRASWTATMKSFPSVPPLSPLSEATTSSRYGLTSHCHQCAGKRGINNHLSKELRVFPSILLTVTAVRSGFTAQQWKGLWTGLLHSWEICSR